jgi:hypothetical protein
MALYDTSGILGPATVRPSVASFALLADLERSQLSAGGSTDVPLELYRPMVHPTPVATHTLQIVTSIPTTTTKTSVKWKLPFPIDLLEVQFGCETDASVTAAPMDLLKNGTTVLAAPVDIVTSIQTPVPTGILTTAYQCEQGDTLQLSGSSTGGTVVGAQVVITYRRR